MKLKNNKSGFTLLEIIIVIIIVGVLASLALPRFFDTVEYSRATEAMNAIGTLKRGADRCAIAVEAATGVQNDYDNCDAFDEIGVEDPGGAAGSNFTYTISGFNTPDWEVVAERNGGASSGNTITFTYDVVAGTTGSAGTGPYGGIR